MPTIKRLFKSTAVIGPAILLSGCVIEPAWGPYHHHHYYRGY